MITEKTVEKAKAMARRNHNLAYNIYLGCLEENLMEHADVFRSALEEAGWIVEETGLRRKPERRSRVKRVWRDPWQEEAERVEKFFEC